LTGSARQPQPRRFSRIAFEGPATLESGARRIECTLRDISLKGALVELRGAAPGPGEPCALTVPLDGAAGEIRMNGKVVHAAGGRVGILSESLDLESIEHLRRLVEVNLGDEALLHRELAALVGSSDF